MSYNTLTLRAQIQALMNLTGVSADAFTYGQEHAERCIVTMAQHGLGTRVALGFESSAFRFGASTQGLPALAAKTDLPMLMDTDGSIWPGETLVDDHGYGSKPPGVIAYLLGKKNFTRQTQVDILLLAMLHGWRVGSTEFGTPLDVLSRAYPAGGALRDSAGWWVSLLLGNSKIECRYGEKQLVEEITFAEDGYVYYRGHKMLYVRYINQQMAFEPKPGRTRTLAYAMLATVYAAMVRQQRMQPITADNKY